MNGERQTGPTELPAAGLPAAESSDAADVARKDQADREADAALAYFERSAVEDLASILSTDLAEIDVTPDGLVVRAMVPGLTLEALQAMTQPRLRLADDCRTIAAPAG